MSTKVFNGYLGTIEESGLKALQDPEGIRKTIDRARYSGNPKHPDPWLTASEHARLIEAIKQRTDELERERKQALAREAGKQKTLF